MAPSDRLKRFAEERLQALQDNRVKEITIIGQELKALIQFRIQTAGQSYSGSDFVPYTPGYAAQRENRGRQTDHVDFTDTGRMWASVQPFVESNGAKTSVTIKAGTPGDQVKVDGAEKKRGNILQPSKAEEAFIRELNANRVRKYIKP
jgi:hypothetical protein